VSGRKYIEKVLELYKQISPKHMAEKNQGYLDKLKEKQNGKV
jgi:hypothetical protein